MTVLVTGAGGAIGGAIVRLALERDDAVLAQDLRADPLSALAPRCAATVVGDLLDDAHRATLLAAAREHEVDAVVAAHGLDGSGSLASLTPDQMTRVMRVNALSVVRLFELLLPLLRERRGTFVAVGSQAGLKAEANNVAYCASKFAITEWVRSLAPALAADGVQLRTLAPGCTESPLLFSAQERFAAATGVPASEFVDRRRAAIPVGRFARVEETAAAALYLADRDSHRPVVLAATGGEVLA